MSAEIIRHPRLASSSLPERLDALSCRDAEALSAVRRASPAVTERMIDAGISALTRHEGEGDCVALVTQIFLAMWRLSSESDATDAKDDQPAS